MSEVKTVCVGMIGAGYAAWLHGNGYRRICGVPVRLKTIVDLDVAKAEKIKDEFDFEQASAELDDILMDPDIHVLDITTPPNTHVALIERALAAGKHVICEKPLLGYLGMADDVEPIGKNAPKSKMYAHVDQALKELQAVVSASSKEFFYAENYLYAEPVRKVAEIVSKRKSKILYMKAVSALKGSSSPVAGNWSATGGGCFIRNGVHPLAAILWLKQVEAAARGEVISVASVNAEMTVSTDCLSERELRHISARPVDVEDNAVVSIVFSDGTGASIYVSDTRLGGTRNSIDLYCNDGALECNLNPNDILNSYFLDEEGLEDVNIGEMLPSVLGWNKVFICDDAIRGHSGELQSFMESIAFDRPAEIGFDLVALITKIVYAAYLSAEEGRRITL